MEKIRHIWMLILSSLFLISAALLHISQIIFKFMHATKN